MLERLKKLFGGRLLEPKCGGKEEVTTIRVDEKGEKHIRTVKRDLSPEEAKAACDEVRNEFDDVFKSFDQLFNRFWSR